MQNIKMKSDVYSEYRMNERGFTLISSLLRLLIIVLTLPVLVFVFSKFKVDPIEDTLSLQQFFYILQNEMYLAHDVTYTNNQLLLSKNNKVVSFERYGGLIRRRVNNTGHEVYHRNVNNFEVNGVTNGIIVTITTTSGDVYERILTTNRK